MLNLPWFDLRSPLNINNVTTEDGVKTLQLGLQMPVVATTFGESESNLPLVWAGRLIGNLFTDLSSIASDANEKYFLANACIINGNDSEEEIKCPSDSNTIQFLPEGKEIEGKDYTPVGQLNKLFVPKKVYAIKPSEKSLTFISPKRD